MDFKETETQFAVLAESLPQLVWSARPDGFVDYVNRRWCEFTGLPLAQSTGDSWQAALHPGELPGVLEQWRRSLETGEPYEREYRIRNAAGDYEWFLSRAIPIQDLSGRIVRWFGTNTNIDAHKRTEDALRMLEGQYRQALEAADLGTWQIDLEKGLITWDEGTCALYRLPHNGLYSLTLDEAWDMIHPEDREAMKARLAEAAGPASNGHYEGEYRAVMPDGKQRWFRSLGQALYRYEGGTRRAVSLYGVVSDITERHTLEEGQKLLMRELNHRVKNLFAIANGMVSMTARTARDPKDMATALRGRLSALSRAHELVQPVGSTEAGQGAGTELSQLIGAVLEPYRQASAGRITIEGPHVPVGSNTTTSLALVLHELATNAAKYGCLSHEEGALDIHWSVKDDTVDFIWTESGGPAIESAPNFEGFGTQLSLRSITGQLGGALDREWRPEGLRVHMVLPLSRLSA
ncbi:PAS domain S-box-containing protein [Microvirga flocculans]|uniref:Blue-light-activated histidine kinase n=1 Tax=Microvirga flocculans TaxID=217168 RepID=A0A7W6IGS5_9HYPH|nr:sensor histidine kinase [Microvirga flocculans]MBB4041187.1 PAS domain S-box-containing protein [Microvirga flocculans]